MRAISNHDHDRAQAVLGWPVRELLLAYVNRLRAAALDGYRHAILVWAIKCGYAAKPPRPPKVPRILE